MRSAERSGGDKEPLSISVTGNDKTSVLIDRIEHRRYTITNVPRGTIEG
jgi:hypothetical protein